MYRVFPADFIYLGRNVPWDIMSLGKVYARERFVPKDVTSLGTFFLRQNVSVNDQRHNLGGGGAIILSLTDVS